MNEGIRNDRLGRGMTARGGALAVGLALGLALPTAVMAAPPEIVRVDVDDPVIEAADGAELSGECGVPVVADYGGGWTIHVSEGGRHLQVTNYHFQGTFTNPDNGQVVRFNDAGPDRVWMQGGHVILATTGRSTTGTGTIGVLVVDLDTGDVVKQSGRVIGTVFDDLCDRLS